MEGVGTKAELIKNLSKNLWSVKVEGKIKTSNWAEDNFKLDDNSPHQKEIRNKETSVKEVKALHALYGEPVYGDFVRHICFETTQGRYPVKLLDKTICTQEGEILDIVYADGSKGRWSVEYVVKDEKRLTSIFSRITAIEQRNKASNAIISGHYSLYADRWLKDKFNYTDFPTKKSEEDNMSTFKLNIKDNVTINGADAANCSSDALIEYISQAEVQVKEYEAIEVESKAIKAKIKQLKGSIKRLVDILDEKYKPQ